METIDDTGFGGIRLIQNENGFRYGIDAVLLADYVKRCCPRSVRTAELGCGNGIVSLLLAQQMDQRQVTGFDIQQDAVELACRSAALNGLTERVRFETCDVAQLQEKEPGLGGSFDLVVSNPPYIAAGSGLSGARTQLQAARQETTADLECFVKTASWLLRSRGVMCMVHRPFRLVDLICHCRKHRLEPKRICFVHPREGEEPNILLLYCVRDGGRELQYDNPIYVYGQDGNYSRQILRIYGKEA